MKKILSHTDINGKANMVDVSAKQNQLRIAKAKGTILLNAETVNLIKDNLIKKGDVLVIAEIAGIQAAKRTSELIPLCHPLLITKIDVKAQLIDIGVEIISEVRCIGQTGIEMEALTAVNIALLTVYDMCKAVDKNMRIESVYLVEKTKQNI
ncbi:MAG: molybdenum cofactor biosynthesis protein C [Bacteroidetes bacterium CG2_30_32_10]|nr:MAG: molybdenum cofactor biosynthesis protein C [Bacteroidetes bacterium CG2_30_32_10]